LFDIVCGVHVTGFSLIVDTCSQFSKDQLWPHHIFFSYLPKFL